MIEFRPFRVEISSSLRPEGRCRARLERQLPGHFAWETRIAESGARSAAKRCPSTARYVRLDVSFCGSRCSTLRSLDTICATHPAKLTNTSVMPSMLNHGS